MDNGFELAGNDTIPRRYADVSKEKAGGATYTPVALAEFVARRMLEAVPAWPPVLRILDPAAGDGALLAAILAQLPDTVLRSAQVVAFDTDVQAADKLEARIRADFPAVRLVVERTDFLMHTLARRGGEGRTVAEKFDLVISNPPYVRTQILGAKLAQSLARSFGLAGRVDLFQPFLLAIAEVLAPQAIAGIIVSNRMMTTKGCAALRRGLLTRFRMIHAWDLGDSKPFGAAVLPAVLLASTPGDGAPPRMTTLYASHEPETAGAVTDPLAALMYAHGSVVSVPGARSTRRFLVQSGTLDNGGDPEGVWRVATPASDLWMETVMAHAWGTFGDLGKIRVGIKTTADKVFIRDDWETQPGGEPELLRPLTTRRSARRFVPLAPPKPVRVLYPHRSGPSGRKAPVELGAFPRTADYLERHRSTLEARAYVQKAKRRWYEIWVPQDPAAWERQKLVFPDIAEKPMFWIEAGPVVNGDCYWLLPEEHVDPDLIWIAMAVGNSTFVETFYDHRFNNKLYAGRRRFITQYVEKFPLPNPALPLSREIAAMTRRLCTLQPSAQADVLATRLDALVSLAFGL